MNKFKNIFHRTTFLTKIRTCLKWVYRPAEGLFKPLHVPFKRSKKNEVHWKQMNNIMKHSYHRKELVINDFENIHFFNFKSAEDGKNLSGLVYEPHPESKKWVIASHWYAGNKWWGLYHALPFAQMGYNIMAFDLRGHGNSEWDTCTMGVKETRDLLGALEWLYQNKEYDDLALVGTSMSAFMVSNLGLQYANEIQKYNIKYGVADCPFGSMTNLFIRYRNIYLKFIPKRRTKKVVSHLINMESKFEKKNNCDLMSADTFKYLESGIKPAFPILFIHSKNDLMTPFTDTYQLLLDRKNLIEGDELNMYNYAVHARSLRIHFKTYVNTLAKFIADKDDNQEQYEALVQKWKLNEITNKLDRKDQKLK